MKPNHFRRLENGSCACCKHSVIRDSEWYCDKNDFYFFKDPDADGDLEDYVCDDWAYG